MQKPFRDFHLEKIIIGYEQQKEPIDIFLNKYFRNNRALGSRDRAYLSEMMFQLIKWKELMLSSCAPNSSWIERIKFFNEHSLDYLQQCATEDFQKVSFPKWLFNQIESEYGKNKALEFCTISNSQAPSAIRVNTLKIDRLTLFKQLKENFPIQLSSYSPEGLIFEKRMNYFDLPEFKKGYFEVQDEGSQLIGGLIEAKSQDHVLDFCAGSGGKTLAFAPKLQGKGQIYLHDIRKKALLEAKKRLNRAGIQNFQILYENDIRFKKLKKQMDWILVDAPCSGTGTLRRNPDMKWRLTQDQISSLIQKQREIFKQALPYLKPKGKIVYVTCSVLKEENEMQIQFFKDTYHLSEEKFLKILPTQNGPDGFFGSVLTPSI